MGYRSTISHITCSFQKILENNRKGRLKTLIGDFQTTFVFAGWSVRILEIQFRFQLVSTRHADDGEAAVVLPALYLPLFGALLALVANKIIKRNVLGTDEATLEITMNNARHLRGNVANADTAQRRIPAQPGRGQRRRH